jgi:hypothetical protein
MKRSETYKAALNEARTHAAKRLVDIAIADNPGMSKQAIYTEVGKDLGISGGACKVAYLRGNGAGSGNGNGNRNGLKTVDKLVLLSNELDWDKSDFQKHRKVMIKVLGISEESYDKAVTKEIDWS